MNAPLTERINSLTAFANETTGKEDTTLFSAVGHLVEGYGGSDSFIKLVDEFEYELSETTDCSSIKSLAQHDFYTPLLADYESIGSTNGFYIYVNSLLECEEDGSTIVCASEHFRITGVAESKITIAYNSAYHKWCNSTNTDSEVNGRGWIIGDMSLQSNLTQKIHYVTPTTDVIASISTTPKTAIKGKYKTAIYRINMME